MTELAAARDVAKCILASALNIIYLKTRLWLASFRKIRYEKRRFARCAGSPLVAAGADPPISLSVHQVRCGSPARIRSSLRSGVLEGSNPAVPMEHHQDGESLSNCGAIAHVSGPLVLNKCARIENVGCKPESTTPSPRRVDDVDRESRKRGALAVSHRDPMAWRMNARNYRELSLLPWSPSSGLRSGFGHSGSLQP